MDEVAETETGTGVDDGRDEAAGTEATEREDASTRSEENAKPAGVLTARSDYRGAPIKLIRRRLLFHQQPPFP